MPDYVAGSIRQSFHDLLQSWGVARFGWEDLKTRAQKKRIKFQIEGIPATFYMGPDIFPGSFLLAWVTREELESGTFLDHRVRSADPDDFLKRFEMIREELRTKE